MVFQYDAIHPKTSVIELGQPEPEVGDDVLVQGAPASTPVAGKVLTAQVGEVAELEFKTVTLDIYVEDGTSECRDLQAWLLRGGDVGVMIISHDEADRDAEEADA